MKYGLLILNGITKPEFQTFQVRDMFLAACKHMTHHQIPHMTFERRERRGNRLVWHPMETRYFDPKIPWVKPQLTFKEAR